MAVLYKEARLRKAGFVLYVLVWNAVNLGKIKPRATIVLANSAMAEPKAVKAKGISLPSAE